MTVAILLLACLVLAGAVVALASWPLRELRGRVQALETSTVRSPGLETGAERERFLNQRRARC